MSTDQPYPTEVPCIDVVDLITAYLDDALPDDLGTHIDVHLAGCAGCHTALEQWRTVIALAGRLSPADVDNTDHYTCDRLVSTFRLQGRR